MEGPGQWICKLSALPRVLRVHNKAQARKLMDYFQDAGFLEYEILDEELEVIRFTIRDWKRHCVHFGLQLLQQPRALDFFFLPAPVGRHLIHWQPDLRARVQFSELDAIMGSMAHTIFNDHLFVAQEYMPVVYYTNMKGQPLAVLLPIWPNDGVGQNRGLAALF